MSTNLFPPTDLDASQVLQHVYDDETQTLRTTATATIVTPPALEIAIDKDDDSITAFQGGTWEVEIGAIALPTGASTSANQDAQTLLLNSIDDKLDSQATATKQDTGNTSLSSIDGKIPANLTVTSTRLLVDGSGVTQPVSDAGGSLTVDNTGTFAVQAAQSGTWNVNNISGTVSLPTGAATSAKQDTGNASLASIDSDIDVALSTRASESTLSTLNTKFVSGTDIGDVTINNLSGGSAVNIQDGGNSITIDGTVGAVQSGTWNINDVSGTVSLPIGASTTALQTTGNTSLSSIDTKLVADSIVVSGTLSSIGQNLEIDTIGYGTVTAQIGSFPFGSLSPGGIGFEATLDGSNWFNATGSNLTTYDGQLPTQTDNEGVFGFNVSGFTKFRLVGGLNPPTDCIIRTSKDASVITQIQAVTFVTNSAPLTAEITSSVLPTDAATQTTLSALNAKFSALGQNTMANSTPVVLSSNQSAIPASQSGTWNVTVNTALPTGTNNIGDVDVLTLPALSAGTNNIGDVDVLTLPSIPAGNNNIGDVDIASGTLTSLTQMNGQAISMGTGVRDAGTQRVTIATNDVVPASQSGTWNIGTVTTVTAVTAISNALPAGTNAIGKLAANSGIDIGDVDVTSLPALTAGTNRIGSVRLVDSADADLTTTKGTQTSRAVGTQDLKDSGRVHLSFYAVAAAAGTTTTETAITLTKSSGTSATSTGTSFVVTNGKRFRITHLSVATRANVTATIQTTTFNLRINTAGAVITSSTPIIFSARSATPATSSDWDRYIIPIPDGYEILGDGTLQFGITAAATYIVNAPTWDVNIIGFEY